MMVVADGPCVVFDWIIIVDEIFWLLIDVDKSFILVVVLFDVVWVVVIDENTIFETEISRDVWYWMTF